MTNENYILTYYQKIKDGSIVVGKYVYQAYERIVNDLKDKKYFFDNKKAQKAITFIENFVHHHEGALAPQLVKLELWQKAFIACIFGLVDEEGCRQFTEVVLVVGRKNGKTLLGSGIAEYMLYCGDYGARVYFSAPKLQQASLAFDAMYQSILQEEDLKEITKKRKSDLYIAKTNSSAAPLAMSAKKSDGLNPSMCLNDELSSWAGINGIRFYEVLRSAFGARREPLLVNITTSGYENEGAYDLLIARCTKWLNGDSKETKLLPLLYMIDDVNKWNDINELQKSNPNLNVSTSVDFLLEEIAIAENSLSKHSEFLTKYCNIKSTSSASWLRADTVNNMFIDKELDLKDFQNCYCLMGLDASQTMDLSALTMLIQKGDKIYTFAHFWLPREKIQDSIERDHLPYELYIKRGWLSLSGENYIDYRDIEEYILNIMRTYRIYPLCLGYDRYSIRYLIQDLGEGGVGIKCDDVYQGDNLDPVLKEMEGMFKDKTVICSENDLLKVHLLDAAIKYNHERGKGRLVKIHQNAHIDGVASLACAFCARQKWWAQLGPQLMNIKKDK